MDFPRAAWCTACGTTPPLFRRRAFDSFTHSGNGTIVRLSHDAGSETPARTAARGFAWERRGSAAAPGSPTRTPGLPREGSPAGSGFGPIPAPIVAPSHSDRIAIQVGTGGRRWDPLTADTDAVTLSRRSPGPTLGLAHSPAASASAVVLALVEPIGGTGPWAGPLTTPLLRPIRLLPMTFPAARRSRRASSR